MRTNIYRIQRGKLRDNHALMDSSQLMRLWKMEKVSDPQQLNSFILSSLATASSHLFSISCKIDRVFRRMLASSALLDWNSWTIISELLDLCWIWSEMSPDSRFSNALSFVMPVIDAPRRISKASKRMISSTSQREYWRCYECVCNILLTRSICTFF